MFLIVIVLCLVSLYIGARIGWKIGFDACKRMDDKILEQASKKR